MIIEFIPEYCSWDDWNGNLVHFFGEQQFPVLSEDQWQAVAQSVTNNPIFDKFAVPDPAGFDTWQGWARALIQSVNGAQ